MIHAWEATDKPLRGDVSLTNHGKQIRVINGSLVVVAVSQTRPVKYPSHCQAKVGSESVNDHGRPNVVGLSEERWSGFNSKESPAVMYK